MNKPSPQQLSLDLPEIVVHCFFRCKHVVRTYDPQEAHDLMEQHYASTHAAQIERIVAPYKRERQAVMERARSWEVRCE